MRTNLQVPLDTIIRDKAAAAASEQGFSSLQDAVRVFLTQLADHKVKISISTYVPDEVLTEKEETALIRKYRLAMQEIRAGKGFIAHDADDLISQLDEE